MGSNVSKQTIDTTKENVTNIINESITEVNDDTTAYGTTKSTIEVVNEDGSKIKCKELNISNTAELNVAAIQEVFTDITSEKLNEVSSKIQDELVSASEQANEGISLGQSNVAIQKTLLSEKVATSINNSIKNTFETNVVASGGNNASTKIINSGDIEVDGECNFTSEAVSEILAKNVAKRIIEDLMKTLKISESSTTIDQKHDQTNEGITMGFLIAAAVLILLVIVAFVMIKKKAVSK